MHKDHAYDHASGHYMPQASINQVHKIGVNKGSTQGLDQLQVSSPNPCVCATELYIYMRKCMRTHMHVQQSLPASLLNDVVHHFLCLDPRLLHDLVEGVLLGNKGAVVCPALRAVTERQA